MPVRLKGLLAARELAAPHQFAPTLGDDGTGLQGGNTMHFATHGKTATASMLSEVTIRLLLRAG